jgi:hypothetical protein
VVWADDGEEYIETVAAAGAGRMCTCGYRTGGTDLASVWLDAADVTRR